MRAVPQTLRRTLRIARRRPGFVALVIVTLAVGIGATTAAMSVAASVLLNPLPVRDDSRLVLITKNLPTDSTLVPFSYAEIAAWREASRTLEAIAGVQYDGAWPWPAESGDRAMVVTGTGRGSSRLGSMCARWRSLRPDPYSAPRLPASHRRSGPYAEVSSGVYALTL